MAQIDSVERAAPGFTWTGRHVMALLVLNLAGLLDAIDVTVINVALPSIETGLGFSNSSLAWVVNAYLVVFGGFLLLGGRAGDVLGRRRVFLAGVVLFTLGSLACGIAQDAGALVAARAFQGLGAALVAPMSLALLADIFPAGAPRNRAFAIGGITFGVSGALGLILGGVIVNGAGWRWVFFVNVPIGVFVLLAALRYLPSTRPAARHRRFDAVGAVTATAGLSLLAYAVVRTGAHGWGSARTVALLAVAALLVGYFVLHEARVAGEPLVPLALFRNRAVAGANAVSALLGSAMFATLYFASLYQQQVLGYSALRTGLAFIPMTLVLVAAAGAGPMLVTRFGVRAVVPVGALLSAAGLALLTRISADGHLLTGFILPSMVLSLGFAVMFIPMTLAALDGVPAAHSGVASALLNVTRYVGGALGLAVVTTVVVGRIADLAASGTPTAQALTSGFRLGFGIAAALMLATAIVGLAVFPNAGRGEKVDILQIQTAALDD